MIINIYIYIYIYIYIMLVITEYYFNTCNDSLGRTLYVIKVYWIVCLYAVH